MHFLNLQIQYTICNPKKHPEKGVCHESYSENLEKKTFNSFVPNAPFLYALITMEIHINKLVVSSVLRFQFNLFNAWFFFSNLLLTIFQKVSHHLLQISANEIIGPIILCVQTCALACKCVCRHSMYAWGLHISICVSMHVRVWVCIGRWGILTMHTFFIFNFMLYKFKMSKTLRNIRLKIKLAKLNIFIK